MPKSPNLIHLGLLVSLALLTGCTTSLPAIKVIDLPPEIGGVWQSNGYGYILDVTETYPRLFHYTSEFCIEDEETAAQLSHYLTPDNLAYSENGEAFYFSATLEDYPMELRTIPKRPQTCGLEISSDSMTSFESFVSYMKTHYAFFDLYGVDWDAASAHARQDISSNMSDAELYAVITKLLQPLKDGHLELNAVINGQPMRFEPGQSHVQDSLDLMAARDGQYKQDLNNYMLEQYWMSGIAKDILGGKGKMTANEMIQFGIISGDIGYIAVAVEGGYADKGEGFEAADKAVLDKALDQAISTFNTANAKSVIIDLSVNFGGYDFISKEIAARFAVQQNLAYTKYAADSTITTPFPTYIVPHAGLRYDGPVVLVTSNVTVSAGEILTLGLRTQPNVVHVGEATRGALSDVLTKILPNGWTLELSNEVYHDHTGKLWEGVGIAPDVPMQIFDRDDPFVGHVQAIQRIVADIDAGKLIKP